jgi:hypothetical protein
MVQLQVVRLAALVAAEFAIEWVDVRVRVFANLVKVVVTEVAKAKVIFSLVHYLNQINKVIYATTRAGNICQ